MISVRWPLIVLLLIANMINYIDRVKIGKERHQEARGQQSGAAADRRSGHHFHPMRH